MHFVAPGNDPHNNGFWPSIDNINILLNVAPVAASASSTGNEDIDQSITLTATDTDGWTQGNALDNTGFEDSVNQWEFYPESSSYTVLNTGETMHNSTETFTAYEGNSSLKLWGLYSGDSTENNVFQTFFGSEALEVGSQFEVRAMLYSHSADHIGTGNNYVILFAKYFGDGYSWIGWDISDTLNAGDAADVWHYRSVSCTVPDGATIVQVGALLYQPTNNDHGSAYIDRFEMYGDFLSYSIASSPSNGTLSGAPPFVTFSPNDNYNGTDSFTFTASDGLATSNTAVSYTHLTLPTNREV